MALTAFLTYLSLEKKYSKHTTLAYKTDIEAFRAFCSKEYQTDTIENIPYTIIRSWVVSLVDEGITNRTVNRKIAALKAYYKFLLRVGDVSVNPLTKHKALKTSKKLEIPFSAKEMENVLAQIQYPEDFEGIRDKLLIELLYVTGIRRAELINLQLGSLDLQAKTIKVVGKRNKERIIPLLPSTIPLFNVYLEARSVLVPPSDERHVFLSKMGNKMYETLVYRTINGYFSKVSSKVKKSPHILRHTFATHLLNQGADLNSVKELLGHSSLASTQVYTHNSIAELKKVHSAAHPRSKE